MLHFSEVKLSVQGSKLTLANSQNASAFDNLRVRKIATSKRLRVRIIHVYKTFGKNLQVISPVCQQKKILLAKLCKWTKKLTSSLAVEYLQGVKSRFARLEKFSLNFSSSLFVIHVNLLHP